MYTLSPLPPCLTLDQIRGHLRRRAQLAAGTWEEVWAGGLVSPDRGRPLLFLDVDGVLHPTIAPVGQRRALWPLVEAVLDDVPGVDVVWSSAWRYQKPWEVLMAPVPPRLHERFLGATPAHLYPRGYACPPGPRRLEVNSFLHRLGDPDRAWLALDDQPLFDGLVNGHNHVLYSDPRTGLLPGAEGQGFANQDQLRDRLQRLTHARL